MVIFGLPRMASRSINDVIKQAYKLTIDNQGLNTVRYVTQLNRLHHWAPMSFIPEAKDDPEQLIYEENIILNKKYRDFTWMCAVRHPATRFKSSLNWLCNSKREGAIKTAHKAFKSPENLPVLQDFHALNIVDKKYRKIDHWLRVENLFDDIMAVPRFKEDIDKDPHLRIRFYKELKSNSYTQPKEDQFRLSINDLPEIIFQKLYKEYRFLYDRFDYPIYPKGYKYEPSEQLKQYCKEHQVNFG